MSNEVQKKISGVNAALSEIKNAVNSEDNAIYYTKYSLSNFENGYGGQGARNIYNNINDILRGMTSLSNDLIDTANKISAEKSNLQQNMK